MFFKFSGAPESKFIFTTLGVEPWGRGAAGLLELIAVAPRFAVFGGLLAVGLMTDAILGHFTKLGLVVQDDGGLLFAWAVTVFVSAALVVWLRRFQRRSLVLLWPENVAFDLIRRRQYRR